MDNSSIKKMIQSMDESEVGKLSQALEQLPTIEKLIKGLNTATEDINLPSVPEVDSNALKREVDTASLSGSAESLNDYQSASELLKELSDEALSWKQNLPEKYKPAILALLYGGIRVNVTRLAQASFHGIRIEGELNGAPCSILAHQATVQLLCYAEPVVEEKERRPIGFIWSGNNVEV